MKKVAMLLTTVLALAACADASGGPAAPGGGSTASINNTHGTVGRDAIATSGNGAASGNAGNAGTATADVTVDTRLALDPAAFDKIFPLNNGFVANNPSDEQLKVVSDYAEQTHNKVLLQEAQNCMDDKQLPCEVYKR